MLTETAEENVTVIKNRSVHYLFRMVQALHVFRLESNVLISVTVID
jgi:hypothetical protein